MARTTDARDCMFCADDGVLLDTSVWLCVRGPMPPPRVVAPERYSAVLRQARAAGAELLTSAVVIGEFVHRWLHYEYDQHCDRHGHVPYKEYRGTPGYSAAAAEVGATVEDLLRGVKCLDDAVDSDLLLEAARALPDGRLDYNDLLLAAICCGEDLVLVTDDADFADTDCRIVTANQNLLRRAGG